MGPAVKEKQNHEHYPFIQKVDVVEEILLILENKRTKCYTILYH